MATIVTFPARRQGPSASADVEGGAQILFFTGVRYVRDAEPAPEVRTEIAAADAADEGTRVAV